MPSTAATAVARATRRADPRLLAALTIAAVFHGGLLMSGTFRRTYDAYVHLFFGDHYRREWFTSWEPRWYTGFSGVSYPPGGHQLLAIFSHWFDDGTQFVPVAAGATLLLVVGVYRFAKLWVSDRAAGYAAILLAMSSAIAETIHVFGQLPTILSLSMLLNALPFAHRWVMEGGIGALAAAVALTMGTTAAHHVTTLFGSVCFLGPVLVYALVEKFRTPLPDEPKGHMVGVSRRTLTPLLARRFRRVLAPIGRCAVYGFLVIVSLVVVVLPYWLWSASDPITQVPIPHASRDNFLVNTNAGLVFWLVPWGLMLIVLPYALIRGFMDKTWPLALSLAFLTLFGTGGTTPIPRAILGNAFDILTLDRFTFWATIVVLPYGGRFVESLLHGRIRQTLRNNLGRGLTSAITSGLAIGMVLFALFCANLTQYRPFQPAAIDMDPIVSFINKDQHDRWRFMTLGFGDQFAYLSMQTTAESVDGNYHSARRLPELTSTPVERLEGAKYSGVPGLGSLQQMLANPEKYHFKFIFSNDQFYDPLLSASGWQRLPSLENGIAVWQREDIEPLPGGRLRIELPMWQRIMWGTLPLTAMVAAWTVLIFHAFGWYWGRHKFGLPGFLGRWSSRIDRRLWRSSMRIPATGRRPTWHVLQSLRARARRRVEVPVPARRRRLQAALVVVGLLGSSLFLVDRATEPPTAEETIYAYYDALDLRMVEEAYELLDPDLRPDWQQYFTERSVINGLVASYARLYRIETLDADVDGDDAVVRSRLVYTTALNEHVVVVTDTLRRVGGQWKLEPHDVDIRIPPDQFLSRPNVDYLSQGRRQVTAGTTAYADVLDRPDLSLMSGRLVTYGDQLSAIGEVRNDDVDPAYVTIQAELVDDEGEVLTTYTSAVGAVHTALPGETVPFRVDFEGVAGLVEVVPEGEQASGIPADAGSTAGPDGVFGTDDDIEYDVERVEFEPGAKTPLALDSERIAEVRIIAKAVVTDKDLARTVTAQHIRVEDDPAVIVGDLRNDGTDEVTVPHVFVTLRDENGDVGWIEDVFVSEAIRPQRSQPFRVSVPPPEQFEVVDVPIRLFANNLAVGRELDPGVLLENVGGWPTADIVVVAFTRAS